MSDTKYVPVEDYEMLKAQNTKLIETLNTRAEREREHLNELAKELERVKVERDNEIHERECCHKCWDDFTAKICEVIPEARHWAFFTQAQEIVDTICRVRKLAAEDSTREMEMRIAAERDCNKLRKENAILVGANKALADKAQEAAEENEKLKDQLAAWYSIGERLLKSLEGLAPIPAGVVADIIGDLLNGQHSPMVPADKPVPDILKTQDALVDLWLNNDGNEAKLILSAFKIGRDSAGTVPADNEELRRKAMIEGENEADNDWLSAIQERDWGGEISLAEGNEIASEGRAEIINAIHDRFKQMVPADKARVIAEALRDVSGWVGSTEVQSLNDAVANALAIAREYGLLEDKR